MGEVSVELDALPLDVLRDCIVSEVESRMDLDTLARCGTGKSTSAGF